MNDSDAMITEADILDIRRDVESGAWEEGLERLGEHEVPLMRHVVEQLDRLHHLLESAVTDERDRKRVRRRINLLIYTSLILMDRAQRRFLAEFLPSDSSPTEQGGHT